MRIRHRGSLLIPLVHISFALGKRDMSQSCCEVEIMGSEKVESLRVLVNQKMKLEKYLGICEGLHSVSFIMLIFYVVTYKHSDTPSVIVWSFLALVGWITTHLLEKKILLVKKSIADELFEKEE